MKKTKNNSTTKFERTFEDEFGVSVWKYDLSISLFNPIEVNHIWKFESTKKKKITQT